VKTGFISANDVSSSVREKIIKTKEKRENPHFFYRWPYKIERENPHGYSSIPKWRTFT
jgi:hypothetical protein